MKRTARTETALKIIFILILIFSFATGDAQNVKQTPDGNYISVSNARDTATTSDQLTGKTFTDKSGTRYPVYISLRGKLYVIRTSKTGNKYKFYLKP